MKRSEPLDGLRGLAVLLVLLSHASNAGHDLVPGLDGRGVGRAGVFLFFVLSSFLLTSQVLGRLDAGRPVGWGRFAGRRLLRILPAYALCMGVHVALGAFEPKVALQHLALVRSEAHFWTIPVEVLFYVSLPPIALGLSRLRGTGPRLLAVAALAVILRELFPPDFPAKAPDYRPNVAPFLPIFLVGSGLAVAAPSLRAAGGRARWTLAVAGPVASALLVAMVPGVYERIVGHGVTHTRFHLRFDEFAILWVVVIAACALPARGWMRAAVSVWPLRALGWVSYSAYLFHAMVLVYADAWLVGRVPSWLVGPLFFVGAVAAGAASYLLVERPFMELLRSRGDATDPAAA